TSSGTVASFAGDHVIVNTSTMRLASTSPGTVFTSGRRMNTIARTTSETTITALRLNRSTTTPTNGANRMPGATRAVVTSAIAASGWEEIAAASEVIAKNPTQSPTAEMSCTLNSAKNSRLPNS